MYFKQIYVKIVKMAFKKSDCHDNDIIVFLDELYKNSPNVVAVAVAVIVSKIRIFDIYG